MSAAAAPASPTPFGDRLAAAVDARQSQVVLGLDPDPRALWPAAATGLGSGSVAVAVAQHCRAVIAAVAPAVVAVKLQAARFEALGRPGLSVMAQAAEEARAHELLVIADAKRGDVDVSATAYAHAFLGAAPGPDGPLPGMGADALTVSPYMGADTLEPVLEVARAHGAGIFALVRTSNPGAADVEDLELAEGGRVWEAVAEMVARLGRDGPASGLSDAGAVVGATRPEHLARARELLPTAPFLLPGIGAQGGRVEELAPAFAPGRAAGLVTASRSIVGAGAPGSDPAAAARAEAERLRAATWAL